MYICTHPCTCIYTTHHLLSPLCVPYIHAHTHICIHNAHESKVLINMEIKHVTSELLSW